MPDPRSGTHCTRYYMCTCRQVPRIAISLPKKCSAMLCKLAPGHGAACAAGTCYGVGALLPHSIPWLAARRAAAIGARAASKVVVVSRVRQCGVGRAGQGGGGRGGAATCRCPLLRLLVVGQGCQTLGQGLIVHATTCEHGTRCQGTPLAFKKILCKCSANWRLVMAPHAQPSPAWERARCCHARHPMAGCTQDSIQKNSLQTRSHDSTRRAP